MGLQGYQRSPLFFDDPRKPFCDDPQQIAAYVDPRDIFLPSVEVVRWVPCRKCKKCLQFRQMRWRERAMFEISESPRTWVVTLTFSPVHLAGLFMRLHEFKGTLNQKVDAACYGEVQKYIKRLRKAGHELRYFAVFEGEYEAHQSDGSASKLHRAHYHLMLHEKNRPISWRQITDHWRRGSFSHAKLAGSSAAASYVTKYLTKSGGRIRASFRYGHPQPAATVKGAKSRGSNRTPTETQKETKE